MYVAYGGIVENKYSFNQQCWLIYSKVTSNFECISHIYLGKDFKTKSLLGFSDYCFQVSVCTGFLQVQYN